MIRVSKPPQPPQVLSTTGAPERTALEAAYSSDPSSYDNGTKSLAFDSGLYAHPSVKSALLQAQNDKCAFCESKISHISYGDVEHFRPKAGWRQTRNDSLHRPGYYWLAYEWANLFLACEICNQQFKKNFFPLKVPARRAKNHLGDIRLEEPLLLDPATDQPEQFISFRKEVPYAIRGNARGRASIKFFGLKRAALAERRKDHIAMLDALKTIASLTGVKAVSAQNLLTRLKGDGEPYSSMTRAFLK